MSRGGYGARYFKVRRVHAVVPGGEVVRYERAGKWYLEPAHGKRQRLTVSQAAALVQSRRQWHRGTPGGLAFDRAVAAKLEGDRQ